MEQMKNLTTEEVAEKLGISRLRVQQLCLQRRIRGARLFGRVWMIPSDFTITPGARGPQPTYQKRRARQLSKTKTTKTKRKRPTLK